MFEITSYMSEWTTEEAAAQGYWADLMQQNEARSHELQRIQRVNEARLLMSPDALPGATVVWAAGWMQAAKYKEQHYNTVQVSMLLFRLPHVDADITVTYYRPVWIDPQSASAAAINPAAFAQHVSTPAAAEMETITAGIVQSFRVLDWSLFG